MKMKAYLGVLVSLFLLSCTVMGKKECEKGDWQGQGYYDATEGRPKKHFMKHKRACLKHGIKLDVKTYSVGYNKGIKKLCTYKNGYLFGERGSLYEDTCPENLEADFFKGYVEGRKIYKMEEHNEELKKQREELEKQREALEDQED